eukprot:CAMPEP_0114343188 /NCGR_PEP_ID=MMETSP0101-20121206/10400_1 /TAXON_ID=38822 ORGANISM="Pteridomonas danica, Strain PT" /NCGR_SAMPLE_ID=MMETSP0101 /ASSEMBLY_ACC=CAM_ASM_000211 /LENGTH=57 /DNA_ID=CAMNT_0001477747 /DNA_START=1244 /DNA_END=1414 /DNA_ORIENTATION=-
MASGDALFGLVFFNVFGIDRSDEEVLFVLVLLTELGRREPLSDLDPLPSSEFAFEDF